MSSQLPSFFPITANLSMILSEIQDNDGEVTPELDEALTITQEQCVTRVAEYGRVILQLEALERMGKDEVQRITRLAGVYHRTAERLRSKVSQAMDLFEIDNVDTGNVKISTRRTERTVIDDLGLIPQEYKTVKIETVPDKNAIKAAIKAGTEVGGHTLRKTGH